jgi:hypothetical protein
MKTILQILLAITMTYSSVFYKDTILTGEASHWKRDTLLVNHNEDLKIDSIKVEEIIMPLNQYQMQMQFINNNSYGQYMCGSKNNVQYYSIFTGDSILPSHCVITVAAMMDLCISCNENIPSVSIPADTLLIKIKMHLNGVPDSVYLLSTQKVNGVNVQNGIIKKQYKSMSINKTETLLSGRRKATQIYKKDKRQP